MAAPVLLRSLDHVSDYLGVDEWPHRVMHQDDVLFRSLHCGERTTDGLLAVFAAFHNVYGFGEMFLLQPTLERFRLRLAHSDVNLVHFRNIGEFAKRVDDDRNAIQFRKLLGLAAPVALMRVPNPAAGIMTMTLIQLSTLLQC